jgi:hypothetical protein
MRWAAAPALAMGAILVPMAGSSSAQVLTDPNALLPDIRTVVPRHLNLVNAHQREILRFSNALANTGSGDWRMRPEFPLDTENETTQGAIQEVLDANGNVVFEVKVSEFLFHPTHNHWHINGVALFEVRQGSPTGPLVGDSSVKVTFCLIDWVKLEGNSRRPQRTYADCVGHQGISPGWADQYNHATDGQELDITGAPADQLLYLVSTANHEGIFIESDNTNNAAWVSFYVRRHSQGNPKIEIVGNSCDGVANPDPGLCGENPANR